MLGKVGAVAGAILVGSEVGVTTGELAIGIKLGLKLVELVGTTDDPA